MDLKQRVQLIQSIGQEVIGLENLPKLLENKKNVFAYDGFEPSGRMHIAQGLLRAHNVNRFIKAGVKFKFWIADWFALMNLKLGGNLKKIRDAGHQMIRVWKACGMDLDATDESGEPMISFIWSSEEITKRSDEYWNLVLDIATKFNLQRIKRCTTIMGRKEEQYISNGIHELSGLIHSLNMDVQNIMTTNDPSYHEQYNMKYDQINRLLDHLNKTQSSDLAVSQIFYPIMQCADIFFLGVDICSLGLDQKKVNMLAIEYCDKIKRKLKPVIVSHHMLMGLDGSDKMSKSNPNNTIFMDDTVADIKRKIKNSFCEEGNIIKNPLLDWIEHLILPLIEKIDIDTRMYETLIESPITYVSIDQIKNNFQQKLIHPKCLKNAVSHSLIQMLEPVWKKLQE